MEDVQILQHGLQYGSRDGSIGVMYVWGATPDGLPARVILSVHTTDGQEREYDLGQGDRFPLGSALWEVQDVEPDGDGYCARIVRVDEEAERHRQELRDRWSISPAAWEQGQRSAQEDEQRERELFGGREPFAVPDSETDA
jgi:hypothetical protein